MLLVVFRISNAVITETTLPNREMQLEFFPHPMG